MMSDDDPLRPHSHEPNPEPPTADPTIRLVTPDGHEIAVTVEKLQERYTAVTLPDCYIVSTGHGTSGPFAFTGVRLLDLVQRYAQDSWSQLEVISADGFGNRVEVAELYQPLPARPILLAYAVDGEPLTRNQGLVRMIVPSETDDALRQVKWVEVVRARL
jgi:DMSO/TMAO reductase YedYZ molybdopterin-dependent catalytic subunit